MVPVPTDGNPVRTDECEDAQRQPRTDHAGHETGCLAGDGRWIIAFITRTLAVPSIKIRDSPLTFAGASAPGPHLQTHGVDHALVDAGSHQPGSDVVGKTGKAGGSISGLRSRADLEIHVLKEGAPKPPARRKDLGGSGRPAKAREVAMSMLGAAVINHSDQS
jgi:hypothetical protein